MRLRCEKMADEMLYSEFEGVEDRKEDMRKEVESDGTYFLYMRAAAIEWQDNRILIPRCCSAIKSVQPPDPIVICSDALWTFPVPRPECSCAAIYFLVTPEVSIVPCAPWSCCGSIFVERVALRSKQSASGILCTLVR